MRVIRQFSLYSNRLYIDAVSKIQSNAINEAIPLFQQLKEDPSVYSDFAKFSRVSNYLKVCYVTTRNYKHLAVILEQLLFLNLERPFSEPVFLTLLKDLTRCYVDAGMYERALFLTQSYPTILQKKFYTDNFVQEMQLLESSVALLVNKAALSQKLSLALVNSEISNAALGVCLNNLAIAQLMTKPDDSEEPIKRLKEAIYQLELAKHTQAIDVPVIEDDAAKKPQSLELMNEQRHIEIDRENIESKGDLRTARLYEQQVGLTMLEILNGILESPNIKLDALYKYKLQNSNTLIAIGNLADVYRTAGDHGSSLALSKFGLDNAQKHNMSLYPRFAYSIYSVYNKTGNINMAENFLLSATSMAQVTRSAYEHLAYYKYAEMLRDGQRYSELYTFCKAYAKKFGDNSMHNDFDVNVHSEIKAEDVVDSAAIRVNYLVFEEYNTKIN